MSEGPLKLFRLSAFVNLAQGNRLDETGIWPTDRYILPHIGEMPHTVIDLTWAIFGSKLLQTGKNMPNRLRQHAPRTCPLQQATLSMAHTQTDGHVIISLL